MFIPIQTLFTLYHFTSGRSLFALAQLRKLLVLRNDPSFAEIAAYVDKAIAHGHVLQKLEYRFRLAKRASRGNPDAARTDVNLDRVIAALRDILQGLVNRAVPGVPNPKAAIAGKLLAALFPDGLAVMVQAPYIEQLGLVDFMLREVVPNNMDAIEALGLEDHVEQIELLTEEYREALGQKGDNAIDFAQVRDAREEAHMLLIEVYSHIVARYPTRADDRARSELMEPIMLQNEVIGDMFRSRRGNVDDIDPETGEPVEEPVDNEPEPAPTPSPVVVVGED